jgi:class 3 adenylate cyclase
VPAAPARKAVVAPSAERSAHSDPDAVVGDRRIVTALFADLVDYVRMLAEHDPEEVKRRVDAALAAMDAAVAQFGGTREKFIGDAIFAVFGHPRAHDDDALRASLCALAIRASLADPGVVGDEPMGVRIGLATGEVVAARRDVPGLREVSLTGPAIVTAARIQSLAGAGEILLDKATVQATRGRLVVEDRGTAVLRGQSVPVELHALRADLSLVTGVQPTGRLVGRRSERARLSSLLEACRSTGRGQVATVVGEPGMGKSRLLSDLEAEARSSGFGWTWTENVSYGTGEPYRFLRAFAQTLADEHGTDSGSLARRLLFTDDLDPATAQRYAGGIAAIAREAAVSGWEAEERHVPSDPVEMHRSIAAACRRYVFRLAEVLGPRVIVIDDFHWIDRSSLPMVDQLVDDAAGLPLVLLFGSRPGPFAGRYASQMTSLPLSGLEPAETGQLAGDVAGAELAAADALTVHERTGGNPLFVGETVRAMLEDGTLAIQEGRAALMRAPSPSIPVTLRALLGARIDALSAAARDTLGVASVVGITFTTDLVAELLGRRPSRAALDRLVKAALVVPVDADTWRFSHALIRDAAYSSLLTTRRRALHARLADRLARDPRIGIGRVAHHRVAAGDSDRALPLLEQAAASALKVGATAEAAAFWRTAADLSIADQEQARGFERKAQEALERGQVGMEEVGTGAT